MSLLIRLAAAFSLSVISISAFGLGVVQGSAQQKAAACSYASESRDKAANRDVNAFAHVGNLGFNFMEYNRAKKKKAQRPARGAGSVR